MLSSVRLTRGDMADLNEASLDSGMPHQRVLIRLDWVSLTLVFRGRWWVSCLRTREFSHRLGGQPDPTILKAAPWRNEPKTPLELPSLAVPNDHTGHLTRSYPHAILIAHDTGEGTGKYKGTRHVKILRNTPAGNTAPPTTYYDHLRPHKSQVWQKEACHKAPWHYDSLIPP